MDRCWSQHVIISIIKDETIDFWELISKFATNFTEYVMWISLQDGFDFVFCMGYGIQNDLTTAEIALGKHNYVRFDFSMGCRRVPCIRTMFVIVVRRAGLLWSQQDFEWWWSVPLSSASLYYSFLLFCLICVYSSQFSSLFWIMNLL